MTESTQQNYLLNLLDLAYETADDPGRLDMLMDRAGAYLFEDQKLAVVSGNFPRFADFDPHLERHIRRLREALEARSSATSPGLSPGHHAQIVFSSSGRILTANSMARNMLMPGGARLAAELAIDPAALDSLKELLRQIQAGVQKLERIIHLRVGDRPPRSAFGYCRATLVDRQTIGLHLTLTLFEWSPALYEAVQRALDLTDSETLVLKGILAGRSREQIARERRRSLDTIKTQCKSILHKAGCTRMTDLTHLCTSIAYIVGLCGKSEPAKIHGETWATPRQNLFRLRVAGGRTLVWYEYGALDGTPVLYVHGFFQGPFFTDAFKQGLLDEGLRLIAPSRPWFGFTDGPGAEGYEQAALTDMQALIEALELRDLTLAAHHGGASHAFRLARHSGGAIRNMVLIGAGIPVTRDHLLHMDTSKRMISAAARHAPSLLRLITTVGIRTYQKKGVQAFLREHYASHRIDELVLDIPEVNRLCCDGLFHLVEQGGEAFVHDGRAQMAHWDDDFDAVSCPQHWLIAGLDHLMKPESVLQRVRKPGLRAVEILEDCGYNILFQAPERVLQALIQATRR